MAHAKSPIGRHDQGTESDDYLDLHSFPPVDVPIKEVLSRFKVARNSEETRSPPVYLSNEHKQKESTYHLIPNQAAHLRDHT